MSVQATVEATAEAEARRALEAAWGEMRPPAAMGGRAGMPAAVQGQLLPVVCVVCHGGRGGRGGWSRGAGEEIWVLGQAGVVAGSGGETASLAVEGPPRRGGGGGGGGAGGGGVVKAVVDVIVNIAVLVDVVVAVGVALLVVVGVGEAGGPRGHGGAWEGAQTGLGALQAGRVAAGRPEGPGVGRNEGHGQGGQEREGEMGR